MDLSIIVLSYNTKDITDECLTRLQVSVDRCQKELNNNVEVIVIDNASEDGSLEMIKIKHPWVKLIASKENTGYSKGNNIGIRRAKFPIILLINSDVFVEKDTLYEALEYFKIHPDCDVLGINLRFGDGSFQPSAGYLPTPKNISAWILGISLIPGIKMLTHPFHPNSKSFFQKARLVGWVSGAFFMVKKEVIKTVGGFDEKIFMYMDEVDLCKRIKNAEGKIWYVPTIKATHLHGASSKFDPTLSLINELKGLKVYFKKYYQDSYSLVRLFLALGLLLRIVAFSLLGKTERAIAYMKGLSVI